MGKIRLFVLAVTIPLLALAAISVISYRSIDELRLRTQSIEDAQQIQLEIAELLSLYKNARAGSRGFLIFGEPAQAQKFQAATAAIPQKIETVLRLTGNNPEQQRRLEKFASTAGTDIAVMRESIRKKAAGLLAKPEDLIAQLASLGPNEGILEKLTAEIRAEEYRQLAAREAAAGRSMDRTVRFIVYGSVAGFALLTCAIGLLLRETRLRETAEEARRKSEEHFHSLAESANDAVISAGSDGRIIFWNRGAQQVFGYKKGEMIGQPLTRLMPQRYRDAHLRGMKRVIETGESPLTGKTIELSALRSDGSEFPMELSLANWESQGELFFTAVIRDITERKQAEEKLLHSEERFRLMVEGVVDYAIYMVDPEGNVDSWNSGAELIHGYRAEEIIGRNFSTFYTPQDILDGQPQQALQAAAAQGRVEQEGWRVRNDGSRFWAGTLITAMRDSSGTLRGFSKITRNLSERKLAEETVHKAQQQLELRVQERTTELAAANSALRMEITERKQAETALRQRALQLAISEQRFTKIFHASPAPMLIFRRNDGVILDVNPSCSRLVGYSAAEIIGRTASQIGLVNEEQLRRVRDRQEKKQSVRDIELSIRTRSGQQRVVLCSSETTELDGAECHLALIFDITERKEAEERAHHIAHHDALTGLPNRLLMQDRLVQAIAHARRSNRQMALLFVDLDHFKHINDSLGHMTGDRLLQMAAIRLQHCLRENDSVARLGGDEFVIILPAPAESSDVITVAEKMLRALSLPFTIDSQELHVSGSIGVSLYPNDGSDADTLMRAADTAMYHAKEIGRGNFQFFMPTLNKAAQQRMTFVNQLHQALDRDEFTLYYQPQVDIETGRIFAVEALLRWQQKGKAALSCNDFIAIAEETGMILPIGEWALRTACRQLRQWRAGEHPHLHMAVNLSARQLYQTEFEQLVARILDENGVPATALELEITEGVLLQPSESNLTTLNRLSQMGVQLAVDDFGMGYSSLAYLRRFPIDTLKIDRSFVSGIGNDPHDMAIVSAIIVMAESLQMTIVAEGVENVHQEAFLKTHGCKSAQGFYYGAPVPAEELTAMLLGYA